MIYEQKDFDAAEAARQKEREEKKIAEEVTTDFLRRREERNSVESGWLLNMNFFNGNQYCDISPFGGLVEEDAQFYWQSRRVFNRLAAAVEARIAKLEKMKPELVVRAFSDEEGDMKTAKLATAVLRYVRDRIGLDEISSRVTVWSEICGCAFFKINWDEKGGRQVAVSEDGKPIYEGEVQVSAISPFEIFPDRLDAENFNEVHSVIHARAVSVRYIEEQFGVALPGKNIGGLLNYSEPSASKLPAYKAGMNFTDLQDGEILIERYTRPSVGMPNGKLEIVAGGRLLYRGDLPFVNGERNERGFPFVKQDSIAMPGAFFGGSVVDRLVPVQRAYNAVRNRKHEFLNRLSMGVLMVEDGSIDTDELAEEGLLPGKVLIYRQGGKVPEMLDCGKLPSEFAEEEEWLEKEFTAISGVSDLSQNSTPTRVTSATGLQLLLSQDESRLTMSINHLERAMKEVGRQILRLYRQFAGTARLMTLTGENKKVQVYYFNASKLDVSDLQYETQENFTPEEKKETLLRLYEAGLLTDKDGNLSAENKNRILEAFGFGSYENARDISALHIAKAGEENLELKSTEIEPDCYDEHELHITEHIRFLLSAAFKSCKDREEVKKRFIAHIKAHKNMKKYEGEAEGEFALQAK